MSLSREHSYEEAKTMTYEVHAIDPERGLLSRESWSDDINRLDEKLLALGVVAEQDVAPAPYEHTISTPVKLVLLGAYLTLSMALTFSLKIILQRVQAPWMLTAMHAAATSIGCDGLMRYRRQSYTALSSRDSMILAAFSTLFTVNISISNISLAMVSVPFHQTVRSVGPLFTVVMYRLFLGRQYSTLTQLSLIPIVFGVCLFTYGNFEFTTAGFLMTLLGVILASFKTIATNLVLTGTRALDPIEALARMSPLAASQAALLGMYAGEIRSIETTCRQMASPGFFASFVALNCSLALLLNISSFKVNKLAGALAQTVCGNVKQCLTVALAIPMFGVRVGLIDGLGILITLTGAAGFSFVELRART